jgi:uncharacterized membrane protein
VIVDLKKLMSRNPGILIALGAALLFGASTPLAKLALSSANPLLVAGLLYLGSGIGLVIVRRIRSGQRTETPLSLADLPWLTGAILAGGVAGPALLLLGLISTSASTASLLLNLEAVATAAVAWIVFRENVDKRVGAGFAFILLGGVLLSLPQDGRFALSHGALLIAAACLCWGIDNNLTRKISGSDPSQICHVEGSSRWYRKYRPRSPHQREAACHKRYPRRDGHWFSRLRRQPGTFRSGAPSSRRGFAQEPISLPRPLQVPPSPLQSDKANSIGRSALRAFSCSSASGYTSPSDTNTNTSMSRWNTNISITTTSTTSTSILPTILRANLMPIATDTRV